MNRKSNIYYVKCNIRHNGMDFKIGDVLTADRIKQFTPQELDRLVNIGALSTNRQEVTQLVETLAGYEKQYNVTKEAQNNSTYYR